jgi:hypothetical protein
MAFELEGTLLGLGSIVRIENASVRGLFVVLARGALRADSEKNQVLPRYLVGPHPYGEAPDRETFPILAEEIQDVVFEGYTDDADQAFLEDLLDQMQHGRRAATPAEQFKDPLTKRPEAHASDVDAADEAEKQRVDPFSDLRALVSTY